MHFPTYIIGPGIFFALSNVTAASQNLGEAWWAIIEPDGVQRVNIFCGRDFIDPSTIVLKSDISVELSVSTVGDLPSHTFTINVPGPKQINADTPIGIHQTKLSFTPGSPGSYLIICRDNSAPQDAQMLKRKQGVLKIIP